MIRPIEEFINLLLSPEHAQCEGMGLTYAFADQERACSRLQLPGLTKQWPCAQKIPKGVKIQQLEER